MPLGKIHAWLLSAATQNPASWSAGDCLHLLWFHARVMQWREAIWNCQSEVPFGTFVFLRTLGWQSQLALPHLSPYWAEQQPSAPGYFPGSVAACLWRKNRMTRACLLAKERRTGDHVLQARPNHWPGYEGGRCDRDRVMNWNWGRQWKSESKYMADTGGMEASWIKLGYEGIQRSP